MFLIIRLQKPVLDRHGIFDDFLLIGAFLFVLPHLLHAFYILFGVQDVSDLGFLTV